MSGLAQKKNSESFGVVLVTCPRLEEGEKIAKGIVENRLAACVNMVRGIDSFFWWEGKVDHAQEILLVIKTLRSRFDRLEQYVKSQHSYQVPEIIFLGLEAGHRPYLDWIRESLEEKM